MASCFPRKSSGNGPPTARPRVTNDCIRGATEFPNPARGNFNFERWDPAPVGGFPEGQSAFGVQGLAGNGWEWTSSVFGPFPGFTPFPFYRGYSADFFDGKHFVMKGGSAQTAAVHAAPLIS